MNNKKYKLILGISIMLITIIYIFLLCSKDINQEISNYYIEEKILNEPGILYVQLEDDKEIEDGKINYQTGQPTYFIRVNYLAQTVTIYEKNQNGYYSKPKKVMICSTGESTPKQGIFQMTSFKKEWLALYGGVYGQYCTQIVGNILFHSVPYTEYENPGSLEYLEYDKLGTEASLGCVRLKVEDAKWIFDRCCEGTMVEFYAEENPGPLGKPKIEKISNYEELRNWDPTDENENNPWKKYLEEKRKKENNLKQVFSTINKVVKYVRFF